MKVKVLQVMVAVMVCAGAHAQVNSGSDGHDGALNPTTNTVINMADHPDGIYHYTEVNIPAGVTVSFVPNAANTPVVWLVQSNALINGTVSLSGQSLGWFNTEGGSGGPGGWRGGAAGSSGQGLGGGAFGAAGGAATGPAIYANQYLLPLLGGSGGGGGTNACGGGSGRGGGGGGGGAILIAVSGAIVLNGSVIADGGSGALAGCQYSGEIAGGSGSAGSVRLVASRLTGSGGIGLSGGAGQGRARIDVLDYGFGGSISGGVFSQGFQPIVLPTAGQGVQLAVVSVGGVSVAAPPSGVLATPDTILAAQQSNPIPIVVRCSNLPLNTPVTVSVKPANGVTVSAVSYNNTGTVSNSTATVSINMPRGGGIIYATAAVSN